MFKSKSFDLVNEEKARKPERLYQPRRMRWLKYIILPAVFAFVLLLILVNVDFSDTSQEVVSSSTSPEMHLERDFAWEVATGGHEATEAIISRERNYTERILMAADPGLVGATTSTSTTQTTTTREPTTSIATRTTEETPTPTSAPSIAPSTAASTTESPNFAEELPQDYACRVPQGDSNAVSKPYEMILRFRNLRNYTAQIAISECESSQTRIIYSTNSSSMDQGSQDLMLANATLGWVCGPAYVYCVLLGEAAAAAPQCPSNRTMKCEEYAAPQAESWFEARGGLIIGVGVAAILMSTLLGMLMVYGTLRMKPSLLRGSKHHSSSSRDSNSVGLIPQESEKNEYGTARAPISTLDNNEYIVAYHRYLEQANLRHMESNKYISPPRERAPSVPPSCDSHPCSPLPLPLPARNNYVYESLDLYEELP